MHELLKLAFRNILRHRRRSGLTGLGMLVGGFLLCFGLAFGDGIQRQLISSMIASNTGHLMITARKETKQGSDFEESFQTGMSWKDIIRDPGAIEAVLAKRADVRRISRRVNIIGMLSNGQKMGYCSVVGLEPAKEEELLRRVVPAEHGRALGTDPFGLYISHTTADLFKVGVGDNVTILAQTADGGTNALDFTVEGIFKRSGPWMEYNTYLNLTSAQQLAMLDGGVTQLKVMLREAGLAGAEARRIRPLLEDRFGVAVKDWEKAGGFFFGIVLYNRLTFLVLWIILFLVVAATVMNTMLMAVHERTREIGTLMAMGTSRRKIAGLFLSEAMLLGFLAAGLGVLLAGGLSLWLGRVGIPAPMDAARYAFGGDRAYPYLTLGTALFSCLAVVALAALSSLYPAVAAARLEPVEALAHL